MANVHVFDGMTSGDAYGETQVRDDINSGDILIVPVENIVGIMVSAWPVAITVNHGEFHGVKPSVSIEMTCRTWTAEDSIKTHINPKPDYLASLELARQEATQRGWATI